MVDKKTRDWANCKGKLALTVSCSGERQFRSIVRSQQSQTSAQITIQLNDDASRIVSKRTVQHLLHRMCFANRRTTRVPLLDAWIGLHVLRGQEKKETGV
ncbi:HTH_Tnp_Tc3_2 domain-containing protein [Trichonephila clavipes]|nr:HTH_Tnp_Tc3_2 domain-containing protein [Trichonephila clavipes]